jgi:hypothetical protein
MMRKGAVAWHRMIASNVSSDLERSGQKEGALANEG